VRNWMPPVAMISWTSGRWQESLFATAHRHEFASSDPGTELPLGAG
jgi:hypothetical protein